MKTKTAERKSVSNPTVVHRKEGVPFFLKNGRDGQVKEGTKPFFNPIVQARLHIGKPDDRYEREADAMADNIIGRNGSMTSPSATAGNAIQGKCAACDKKEKKEEEQVQAKALYNQVSPLIQRKEELQRQPEEEEEEEMLQAKLELQRQEEEEEEMQPKLELQRQPEEEEEEEMLQAKLELQRQEEEEEEMQPKLELQRQPEEEEEEEMLQAKLELQRQEEEEEEMQPKLELQRQPEGEEEEEMLQAKGVSGRAGDTTIESALRASKGGGSPMPRTVRNEMESGFGADFSNVRIHTGSTSAGMSRDIGAQAFTHQNDIYFNEGKYNPGSREGKHLLAHELTHTIQQGASPRLARKPLPDLQLEEESTDFEAELQDSNQEAVDEIDPTPAQQARQEAAEELTEAEMTAAAGFDTSSGATQAPPPREEVQEGQQPAGETQEGVLPTEEPQAGPAGQYLEETSAGVCEQASKDANKLAKNEQTHDDAGEKLKQSEEAVKPPEQEGQAQGNAGQVEDLDQADAPDPKEKEAKDKLNDSLQKAVPRKIKELNEFKSKGKAKVVGNEVLGVVNKDVGEVKKTYDKIEQAPSPAPSETPADLPATESAPPTPKLNLGKDAVPALPEEHTDFSEYQQQSDDLMQKEEIKEEHLEMVDSGDLMEARKERGDLKEKVDTQPAQIQEFAQQETQQVETDLTQEENQARGEMKNRRKDKLGKTKEKQEKTKSDMEKKREEVTNNINRIYEKAKQSVTSKLENLEKQALQRFDQGQAVASQEFEDEVNSDISAWKRKRYSGMFGGAKWLKDKFFGIDDFPEVKQAFDRGKSNFISKIDRLILDITLENKKVIADCKKELADAKKEIREYVDSLGPDLKDIGEKSLKEMDKKLAELDGFVDKKAKELEEKLCAKKEEAIKKIDEKIEKMKEAMSGLLSKLGNLLLDAMVKFFKWALEKAGYASGQLMSIINKGKAVIKKIVTDPIGFIKNLVGAVGMGIRQFSNNIAKHIMNGLMGWLTGAMGDLPITLPEKWDLKGIFSLVLQVLRLTWANIRQRLVRKVPEKLVSAAEKSVGIVKRIIKEGPVALWEMIKEKAAEIKETVIEGIRNWAIVELVKQGIIKLLSFLNPAGAIVQAILAIYNTIMFFVENWQRIVDFVKTVFNSVGDIALGKIGAAAQAVERAMAMTIPIILSFLARLLNLGGIGKAIKNIIVKVGKKVQGVIDKIVSFIAKKVRKLFGKVKKGAKAVVGKLVEWWKVRKNFTGEDGVAHKLYFKGKEKSAKLMVASEIRTYADFIREAKTTAKNNKQRQAVERALPVAENVDKIVVRKTGAATKKQVEENKKKKQKDLDAALVKLAPITAEIFGIKGDLPEPDVTFTVTSLGGATMAKKMQANVLSKTGPQGSSPEQGAHKVFDKLNLRREGGRSYYVRGHLLNDNIHGPGEWKNMTPLTQSGNKNHLRSAEEPVKKAVLSGAVVKYSVKPNYNRGNLSVTDAELKSAGVPENKWEAIKTIRSAEQYVPQTLVLNADLLKQNKKGEFTVKKTLVSGRSVINPVNTNLASYEVGEGKAKERVSIANDSAEKIAENTGIPLANVNVIQIKALAIDSLRTYQQIKDAIENDDTLSAPMKLLSKRNVDILRKLRNVTLN